MNEKSVPWTMWDYQGGFGLFNKGSDEIFEYDINRPLAEAIGFIPPRFKEYVFKADTVPFDVYTDFPGEGVLANVPSTGIADLFSPDAYEGNYGIFLTDVPQYNSIDFDFKLNKDLSKLVAANYTIDFWFKADSPGSSVVLRFLDTKTSNPNDHPWRRDYTINSTVAPFDGQWHFVQISLKKFVDIGSYENNTWYTSTNSFDWKAVDRFQIVSENMALTGKKFWFDNIRINGTPITGIGDQSSVNSFKARSFPNPFHGATTVEYNLPEAALVNVSIYDLTGRKLLTLADSRQTQGRHQLQWSPVQKGIYLCKISSLGKTEVLKLIKKNN